MKQYVGVRFINDGPYISFDRGIVYSYINTLDQGVEKGDVVVVETKYGPAIGMVQEIYYNSGSGSCHILEICRNDWASKIKATYLREQAGKIKAEQIAILKKSIKEMLGNTNDTITLARILTGKNLNKDKLKGLSAMLEELDKLEDTGLPF